MIPEFWGHKVMEPLQEQTQLVSAGRSYLWGAESPEELVLGGSTGSGRDPATENING